MSLTKRIKGEFTLESISTGTKIIMPESGGITIDGDLTVVGTSTSVESTDITIVDNVIVLNSGETGPGVSAGSAGIEIDRGDGVSSGELSAGFRFDETTDTWQVNNGDGIWSTIDAGGGGGGIGDLIVTSIPASDTIASTKDSFALTVNGTIASENSYLAPAGYDVDSLASAGSYGTSISAGQTGMQWKNDGTSFFIITAKVSTQQYTMTEYTVSTPYDVTTVISTLANTFNSRLNNASFKFWWMNQAGTKWIMVFNNTLHEFDLAGAYDFTHDPTLHTSTGFVLGTPHGTGFSISENGLVLRYVHFGGTIYQNVFGIDGSVASIGGTTMYDASGTLSGGVADSVCGDATGDVLFFTKRDASGTQRDVIEYSYVVQGDISSLVQTSINYNVLFHSNNDQNYTFFSEGGTRFYQLSVASAADTVYQYTSNANGGGVAVKLYHEGIQRLATTNIGVQASGVVGLDAYTTALLPTGIAGSLVYDADINKVKYHNGTSWGDIDSIGAFVLDGQDNLTAGTGAGAALTTGAATNFIAGFGTGAAITTGDDNVCIGSNAGNQITTGSSNICINGGPLLADAAASNKLYIGDVNSSGIPLIGGDFSVNSIVTIEGDLEVNGKVVSQLALNAQTLTTYTLVLSDAGELITMSNAAAITLTIPTNASVAFPIGTQILIEQAGAGQVTVAGPGVTLHSAGALLSTASQHSTLALIKKATDTWLIAGDLA